MTDIARVPTGVPGLDVITSGGIPEGRATLVSGRSGTGKSVLALQLACNLARAGRPTLIVAVEETPADLRTSGDALGLGFGELIDAGALRAADLSLSDHPPPAVAGDYEIEGLVERIRGEVEAGGCQAIVIDSSTALFSHRPPQKQLRRLLFRLVLSLRQMGLTSIVTAEAADDDSTVLGIEEFVCDLTLILRNVIDGERRRRSIEITKYRRSTHFKGQFPCTLTQQGLRIFPLDADERPVAQPAERFSSGVDGLDAMNDGGWLRDSIVLVRGPTGSGKTTIAGTYVRAGAQRGERVVYYGFEEPRPILLRNFASLGLPMEPFIEAGTMRLVCRFPEATSPEDLLVAIRVELQEFEPSLIVLDSISSIEHATGAASFRQFIIGLASLLRLHGRSALLTQTIAAHAEAEMAAPYLSTVADAILMMDYTTNQPDLERTMRVLKMRGSSHQTDKHRVVLGPGGVSVTRLVPRGAGAPG